MACPELIHKVEKYSEACGLGDPKNLKEHAKICREIKEKYNIDHEDRIYLLFHPTASKPLRRLPSTSLIREAVMKNIADFVKSNKKVSKKQVEFWLYEQGEPLKTEKVNPLNAARKVMLKPSATALTPELSKLGHLRVAIGCTPYISVLHRAMKFYEQEDELGAVLSILSEWARTHPEGGN